MRRLYGGTEVWFRISNRFRLTRRNLFSTTNKPPTNAATNGDKATDGSLSQYDAYRDLDKLDFMTAAKILFINPPKQKKFGIDFHLVQLFFVCMPSLAVYLVAQYARYEMRRMEAELEVKKRVEEEAKAKEIEIKAAEEKEDPEILEVKERLGKLEEVVKEFVVESKKQSGSSSIAEKAKGDDNEKKQQQSKTESNNSSVGEDRGSKHTSNGTITGNSSQQNTSGSKVQC